MNIRCFIDISYQDTNQWQFYEKYLKNVALTILQNHNVYISICLADTLTVRELNKKFRNKDYGTNVLSFPGNINDTIVVEDDVYSEKSYLGEVILCWTIIEKEAMEYKFSFKKRCSHMLIHGILHLLGYDHRQEYDRMVMERIETSIMLNLGLGNPYEY